MIHTRNQTKSMMVGNAELGGNSHVIIQSMCSTKTENTQATIQQILDLEKAGCEIVRLAVIDEADAEAIKTIKQHTHIPLVADIHYDYRIALLAAEHGIDKIRINPGNIGKRENVEAVVKVCKEKKIPIRVGMKSGLSSICSDPLLCIEAYRLAAKVFPYPLHLGVTEAGTYIGSAIKSSMALGTLLNEGIGNTIRISVNGDPLHEITIAKQLLKCCRLIDHVPNLIACPTCGRTQWDINSVVAEIEAFLNGIHSDITVAVMGCAVNEAKHADIAIAGGKKEGLLIKKGEIIEKLPQNKIVERLKQEILHMCAQSAK